MNNREIFVRDPLTATLPNDGVVAVSEGHTKKEIEALRYELEHFVCEGQYRAGLARILDSYHSNVSSASQPAAWVSGFYGSGKSHLLKILRHLWVNTRFESDGARARDLALLPDDIQASLLELDMLGKRCGGLHAIGGTLPSGGGLSPRLAVLRILFKSKGLPEALPQAQFCLWLQANGMFEQVKTSVEAASRSGKSFYDELHNLYVSSILAQALLDIDPSFALDIKQVLAALRAQFPTKEDLPTSDFIRIVRETLEVDDQLPATLIVLDEIQLYIADDKQRSTGVQEMAEALCKQLESRVLLVGAGQTALAADDPLLERLRDRFTVAVELSDTDVETVTRKVVLAKKADKRSPIEATIEKNRGEIDRQLMGSRIAARSEDNDIIVDDYPLLPVRRRFWEAALRAVDVPGTSSQLRTQLRMVHDAVRDTADAPLGTVVPADYLFEQQRPGLLQSASLIKEIDETIKGLDDGTKNGKLARRLCELIFFIRKLPREEGIDIGVRANPEMLADLLVENLTSDGTDLRRDVPVVLRELAERGILIIVEDGEYSLQTKASSEWTQEFRNQQTRLNSHASTLAQKRSALIQARCHEMLRGIRLAQGQSKEPRKLAIHFGVDAPRVEGTDIPVWVRDGWGDSETTVVSDARAAGNDSPMIFVYIPKASAEDLQRGIIAHAAAEATIHTKGTPTTREGQEAYDAMSTTMSRAEQTRDQIVRDVIDGAKVFQGGGNEQMELALTAKVESAANASMVRLFPEFNDADDSRWKSVIDRARKGDDAALTAVDWTGAAEQHPVTAAILREIGAGKQGKEIRSTFSATPYGWPRDAIDGALIVLHATGHLRTRYKGSAVERGQLDQNKIPMTDFRTESNTLNAKQKMSLRKLFQDAGIDCKSNEEAVKTGEYLAHLLELASQSGGEPPLPEAPDTQELEDLRNVAGNEQLAAIVAQADDLRKKEQAWEGQAKLAAERLPMWSELQKLLQHGKGLPGIEELEKQTNAIRSERRLLDASNPIPDIRRSAASALRAAVTAVRDEYERTYRERMGSLTASDTYKRLDPDQWTQILVSEGIDSLPAVPVGSESDLIRLLERTSLPVWKTKIDALPQQFARAATAAARKIEPQVQTVRIDKATLRTEADADAWWAGTRKSIVEKLEKGPVILE